MAASLLSLISTMAFVLTPSFHPSANEAKTAKNKVEAKKTKQSKMKKKTPRYFQQISFIGVWALWAYVSSVYQ